MSLVEMAERFNSHTDQDQGTVYGGRKDIRPERSPLEEVAHKYGHETAVAVADEKVGQLEGNDIWNFCLAGNAIVTLKSLKTGRHFTYRIREAKDKQGFYFVSVKDGGHREYAYIGVIDRMRYRTTAKSQYGKDAACQVAFSWFWHHAVTNHELPNSLEVYHEGRCGRCARKLTHPTSIQRGIGPECSGQGY